MRHLSDEEMLEALRRKAEELGRTPTKGDVDSDKSMPSSSTYLAHFGGLVEASQLIGLNPTVILGLSPEKVIKLAQDFYKEYGRSPSVVDFDSLPHLPHSCYIRDELGMSWNEFLIEAGLPTFQNGENWIKNRRAELVVKDMLLAEGQEVIDLSETNTNAEHAFIVDNEITVDVRSSSYIYDRGLPFWKFKLHLGKKKYTPEYFVCVGFDDFEEVEAVFLFPTNEITAKECISIRVENLHKSKYAEYLTDRLILI